MRQRSLLGKCVGKWEVEGEEEGEEGVEEEEEEEEGWRARRSLATQGALKWRRAPREWRAA